jgi:hypothetical protein
MAIYKVFCFDHIRRIRYDWEKSNCRASSCHPLSMPRPSFHHGLEREASLTPSTERKLKKVEKQDQVQMKLFNSKVMCFTSKIIYQSSPPQSCFRIFFYGFRKSASNTSMKGRTRATPGGRI